MPPTQKIISRVLFLMIGVSGFIYLAWRIGWVPFLSSLFRIGFYGALALTFCGFLEAFFDSLALQEALLKKVSFFRVFFVNQTGAFFNSLLPAEAGEILKAKIFHHSTDTGLSGTLVWNLVFKLSKSFMLTLLSSLALLLALYFTYKHLLILAFGSLGVFLYFIPHWLIRKNLISRFSSLLHHIPLISPERTDHLIETLRKTEQETTLFKSHHPSAFRKIFLFQCFARLADLTFVIILFSLISPSLSLSEKIFIYTGNQVLTYLLPLMPTRMGTTEGTGFLLFSFLEYEGNLGITFQILLRIKQLIVFAFSGLLFLVHQIIHRTSAKAS